MANTEDLRVLKLIAQQKGIVPKERQKWHVSKATEEAAIHSF